MEISPRKSSKQTQEPVDEWLHKEGYIRKHIPRDPTCLFRAVSEQVYMTQNYHIRVRKECVEFMRKNRSLFEENITIPFESYLEQISCFTEWGGMNEIQAMSLLYKREVTIFNGQKQMRKVVTNNGFEDMLYLCYTPQKQYESVFTKSFASAAAHCQSIVYKILYKSIFNVPNVEETVHKMLHDKTTILRHDKFFLKGNLEIREQLTAEIYTRTENSTLESNETQSVAKSSLPFSYRIAKALDPNIYRNTDFDVWHEIRREVKNAGWNKHNCNELQIGGKCLIQVDYIGENCDKTNNNIYLDSTREDINGNEAKVSQKDSREDPLFYCGYIQEMSKNEGPVLVFIEELGEKRILPYSALKPFPMKKNKQTNNWSPINRKNGLMDTNQKWRRNHSNATRKGKDLLNNSGTIPCKNNQNNSNSISNSRKGSFESNQWPDAPGKRNHQATSEDYQVEKHTNYVIDDSNQTLTLASDNYQAQSMESIHNMTAENVKNISTDVKHSNNVNNDNDNGISNNQLKRGKRYPGPYMAGRFEEVPFNSQTDGMAQPVNCSAQKSIDVNGSDLPLSDPLTLRFFYNLGLEYYHVIRIWQCESSGQPVSFKPLRSGMVHNNGNFISVDNNGNATNGPLVTPNELTSCMNGVQNIHIKEHEIQKIQNGKNVYVSRERTKEQIINNKDTQRPNKNGLSPKFKKNSVNHYTNNQQQKRFSQSDRVHQSNQHFSHSTNANSQNVKNESVEFQHLNPVLQQAYISSYHNAYQTVYNGVPFINEGETFGSAYYVSNAGYFPVPYVNPSEVPEGNSFPPYLPPHVYPGMDIQVCATPGAPYIYPQQSAYSNVPLQNVPPTPEQWYGFQGQLQYVPYAQAQQNTAKTVYNGEPNVGVNNSP